MVLWWNELTLFQQILACMAIPATLLLVIQTVMLLLGMGGGHDADISEQPDISGLTDHDAPDDIPDAEIDEPGISDEHDASHGMAGLRIFTLRGLIAFFAVGGWIGLVISKGGVAATVATVAALAGGITAMVLVALILKWSLNLQEQGNISLTNALHKQAQVYISIPPNRMGSGKVTLTIQERFMELDAVTDADSPIKTGEHVRVTGIADQGMLLVSPSETPKTVISLKL